MRKIKIILLFICFSGNIAHAQVDNPTDNNISTNYQANKEKKNIEKLANEIKEIWYKNPFQGTKIIAKKDVSYLIGIGMTTFSHRKSTNTLNTVASIRARNEVLKRLNGVTQTSSSDIITSEKITGSSVTYYETYLEKISENANGYVQGMDVLTTFKSKDGRDYVYIIYKKL